ncbi:copper amine oxidase N-terminal domain-containing protein [Saccharibacillus sp. CPCC 101409]|uniref:copper amine oxidase N-terminal domain-containing protein n=1 Tax=Saccharibacillus sp. CPCC 101409 TaxID=3058041 RepID=UPI002673D682|nr:copper amine oxidase N-terminal domain-containing protein [Saccharibacillus sp. CPCC 101409]MDO3412263.1 copper amine oxidase N-terminal domain-containing protein [Saccharibacillus sp. CPCC 101409]
MIKRFAAFGAAAMIALSLVQGNAAAAAKIEIIVNDKNVSSDVSAYIRQGVTFVPLNVVGQIPGSTVKWDNAAKTATVTSGTKTVQLAAGQKWAVIDGKKTALAAAPVLSGGRIMVPLRVIAEASGAYVEWSPATQTVFIGKADSKLLERLNSENLAEARTAAVQLPTIRLVKGFEIDPVSAEGQNLTYYFPEGRADRFFIAAGDLIYYYEIKSGVSREVWTAKLDPLTKKGEGALPFIQSKALAQEGKKPAVSGRFAFFHVMPHIGEAQYGFVEADGTETQLGQREMNFGTIIGIEGEQKL